MHTDTISKPAINVTDMCCIKCVDLLRLSDVYLGELVKLFINKKFNKKTHFQPTLTAVLINNTQTFDREYIEYNITPTSTGRHDVYINVRKSNMNLVSKVALSFETKPHEYGYQFINKTFSTCKFYNSKRTEPLLQILYQAAMENPSVLLPRKCPIRAVRCWLLVIEREG